MKDIEKRAKHRVMDYFIQIIYYFMRENSGKIYIKDLVNIFTKMAKFSIQENLREETDKDREIIITNKVNFYLL